MMDRSIFSRLTHLLLLATGLAAGAVLAPTAMAQAADDHAAHHPGADVTQAPATAPAAPAQPGAPPAPQPPAPPKTGGGMDCCKGMMGGMDHDMSTMGGKGGMPMMGGKGGMMDMMDKPGVPKPGPDMGMMPPPGGRPDDRGDHDRFDRMHPTYRQGMLGWMHPALMGGPAGAPLGGSHLYHAGASNFFLERAFDLSLSADQKRSLLNLREAALLDLATHARQIEQAEQELWALTAKKAPATGEVEAKIREIATHEADARIAWFKAVDQAVAMLNDEQREKITGVK